MVGVLAFVVIMVAAMFLYEKLGSQANTGPMMVESSETVDAAESSESSVSQDTADSQEAMKAPDFTIYNYDGDPIRFTEFLGKPVVLNFWASWCGPCKAEMPDFEAAYQKHGKEIQFLMVNQTDGQQETVDTAASFIKDAGYTFPVYYDKDLNAASVYGVSAIPMTFFIDKNGYLAAYAQGTLSAEGLQQGISMIQK